ncbi:oocyte-secreted protein 2 [Choloepus didactylus]|uniref:oocyte-secreted protein 2 n=1 Tax=Choloepus didactylus TaxID=27675 RepID=UPI0018A0C09A|nr:oocyte-secreted protein 2 [Choloepus didactylus]
MKVSMALKGLIFLAAMIWPCTGIISGVQINCSMDWLMITITPWVHSKNLYLFADEFYLGLGCPVTRIQTYAYDFIYPVNECGIRTKVVSEDTLLFQTELYFIPRNKLCDSQKIPLECSASRKSVWLKPVSTANEIKLNPSPFMTDFEPTPEELGLLGYSENGFLP